MSRQMGEMDYGPEEQLNYGGHRLSGAQRPDTEFHLISVVDSEEGTLRPDGGGGPVRGPSHPAAAGRGLPRAGEDGQQRPVRPEDIVIPDALSGGKAEGLHGGPAGRISPCAGGEEQSFFETMEIAVMVSFLQIVDNPRQDVPLLAVLRSPLLGFSPDRLAQIRGGHPGRLLRRSVCRRRRG